MQLFTLACGSVLYDIVFLIKFGQSMFPLGYVKCYLSL